jgi:hypothetical protein
LFIWSQHSKELMSLNQFTRREEAGSLTLPHPNTARSTAAANAMHEVSDCAGNVLLMEARLCEMTSAIRALIRSNEDLEEALKDAPDDPDFNQAVEENRIAIRRKGRVAVALVKEMQAQGANVDLEEDILRVVSGGVVAVVIETTQQQQEMGTGGTGADQNNAAATPSGLFL